MDKKTNFFKIAFIVVCIMFCVEIGSRFFSPSNVNATTKYQYKVVTLNIEENLEQALNKMSEQGWEYVENVNNMNSNRVFIFKK